MEPKIQDNLLPDLIHKNIQEDVLEQKFHVLTNLSGVPEDRDISIPNLEIAKSQVGLGTLIYDGAEGIVDNLRFPVYSQLIDFAQEAFEVKLKKLFRIRVGINLNVGTSGIHMPHTDWKFPHYTLLYYINDADGDTVFYNEFYGGNDWAQYTEQSRNTPKGNTGVLFNGLQYHSSSNPVNAPYRAAININFE